MTCDAEDYSTTPTPTLPSPNAESTNWGRENPTPDPSPNGRAQFGEGRERKEAMGTMVQSSRQVMMGTAPLEECVRRAQVLIVGGESWHLIGPAPYKMHCLNSFAPVPVVNCPAVDVRGVKDDEGMGRVIQGTVDANAGVFNLDGLLTGLEALGGRRVGLDTATPTRPSRELQATGYRGGHTKPVGRRSQVSSGRLKVKSRKVETRRVQ